MEPVLVLGSFQVTPYSLIIFAGALAGVLRVWTHREVRPLLAPVILGALLFGHIFWVLFCPPGYIPEEGKGVLFLRIWQGGYTLYGALAGGALAAIIGARILKLRPLAVLDSLAPGACAALVFARVGDWVSGQGFGEWVDAESLQFFPVSYITYQDEFYTDWKLAVWFWEAAAAAVILVFLLLRAKRAMEGRQTALFLTALGCTQILLEQMRMDTFVRLNPQVRFSQLAAMAAILAVLAVILIRRKPKLNKLMLICATVVFAALGVIFAEFVFDKPQYNLAMEIAMALTAVSMAVMLLVFRKARGLIFAVPFAAAVVALLVVFVSDQWERIAPILYGMIALAVLAIGAAVYLAGAEKERPQA